MFLSSHLALSRILIACVLGLAALTTAQAANMVQIQVKLTPIVQGRLQVTPRYTGQIAAITSAIRVTSCAFEGQVVRLFVQPGSAVAKNAPLITVRTSAQTRQRVAQAKATLDFARKHLAQIRLMLQSKLATQADFAQAEQNLAVAEANWQSLVATGATHPEHTITAKHAGLVQQIQVQLGGVFTANQPLMATVDAGRLEVKVPVPVTVADQLTAGDWVQVQPVFGAHQPHSTQITAIDPMVMPGSNRQPIHLRLPHTPQTNWVLGEAFTAQFTLPGQTGFILPHAAIVTNEHGQSIVWLDHQHKAQAVPVRVLDTVESRSVVEPNDAGALKAGDRVVASGAPNVAAGMTLISAVAP